MKSKLFFIALTLCLIPVLGFTQHPGPGPISKETRERIETQRIGFITQKLDLTPEEAAKFWPVYNEYKSGLKDMRDDVERPDLMSITDEEASALIDRHFLQEQKRIDLQKTLVAQLRNVISPRKIILLQAAEKEFNRELLRKANGFAPPGPDHDKMK